MIFSLFKKKKTYARKRRVWNHDSEPLFDALIMKHRIRAYEIKHATIEPDNEKIPQEYWGETVEVLFYGKLKCEILIRGEVKYISTEYLNFTPIQPTIEETISVGEYVRITSEIESDDEEKELMGSVGDVVLVLKIEEKEEFPYWVYKRETNKQRQGNISFRVNIDEIERTGRRLSVEVV